MRIRLLMSVLSLGLMVSCADDDIAGNQSMNDGRIVFQTTKKAAGQTRSGSTLNTLDGFTVSCIDGDGSKYFSEEKYTYDAPQSVFASTTPHYWPTQGTLSFYAISRPGTVSYDEKNVPEYAYSKWEGEDDLVAATAKAGSKEIPYPLSFKHITSQVRVTAEPENKTEDMTYKLVAVRMKAPSKGVYSFANETGGAGSWSIDNSVSKTYDYSEGIGSGLTCGKNGSITMASTYWNILPCKDGALDYEIEYQVLQNGKVVADFTGNNKKEVSVASPNLALGKQYIYNFILPLGSDDVITFTTTIGEWTDGGTYEPSLDVTYSIRNVVAYYGLKVPANLTQIPVQYEAVTTYNDSNSGGVSGARRAASANEEVTVMYTTASIEKNTTVLEVTRTGQVTWNGAVGDWSAIMYGAAGNYEYVDLGLPSGTLWATCNVGASNEDEDGNYFVWGETEPKSWYSKETYRWWNAETNSFDDSYYTRDSNGLPWLKPEYDAVRANMGEGWCMPTNEQFKELIECCNWEYKTIRSGKIGAYGSGLVCNQKLTSKYNGKVIYFPMPGICSTDYEKQPYGIGSYVGFYPSVNGGCTTNGVGYYQFGYHIPGPMKFDDTVLNKYCGVSMRGVREEKVSRVLPTSIKVTVNKTECTEYTCNVGDDLFLDFTVLPENSEYKSYRVETLSESTGYAKKVEYYTEKFPENYYIAKTEGTVKMRIYIPAPFNIETVLTINIVKQERNANGNEYVDMGLPSGNLWAKQNLDRSGNLTNKIHYTWGRDDSPKELIKNVLGGTWTVPSHDDYAELICNCTNRFVEAVDPDDFPKVILTSKINGAELMLPYIGDNRDVDYAYWFDYPIGYAMFLKLNSDRTECDFDLFTMYGFSYGGESFNLRAVCK